MARRVKLQRREGVAWLTLPGGGEAGFDAELRASLGGALELALAEPGLKAVILRAGEGGWPVSREPGADYAEDEAPAMRDLADRLAFAPVPVVALLTGKVSGGGMALAQAARLRLALTGTQFAAPEFRFGLIPAAGGFVRLARRAGAGAALRFLTAPREFNSPEAMAIGLCDAQASAGTLEGAALGAALNAFEGGAELPFAARDAALADPAGYLAGLEAARAGAPGGFLAPIAARAAEVAEAALLLPEDEAVSFEAVAYTDMAAQELPAALRWQARAWRAAAELPGGVAGAPLDGPVALWNQPEGFAAELLGMGHELRFGLSEAAGLEAAFTAIAEVQEKAVRAGRLAPEVREADWGRLTAAFDIAALSGAVAVIARPRPGEAEAIMAATPGALHVFEAPAGAGACGFSRAGKLVELQGEGAGFAQAAALLRAGGARVIAAGWGLGARLEAAFFAAAERAVMAGAAPETVDRVLSVWGFAEPPFLRADRIGIPAVAARLEAAGRAPGVLFTFLAMEGQTGREEGRGVYIYPEPQSTPKPAPGLAEILVALRAEAGVTPKPLSAVEIAARIWAEMAGEGAAALQAGRAHRAGDVDLAAVAAGFPLHHGGPMFLSDRAGLLATRKRLRALAAEGAPAPVTLWDVLIRNGRVWAELDG